jgi:hypothetical protein
VERIIHVFHRKHVLLMHATSKTVDGLWIATPPGLALTEDAGDDLLGICAKALLTESREGLPRPGDWKDVVVPVYELAGVKGWRAFSRGTKLVSIEETDDGFQVTMWANDGRGFSGTDIPGIRVARSCNNRELGRAIREGLAKCPGFVPRPY